ncbi:MAG: hypothetical protein H7Y07_12890 [Pyrinomonadaceae bacterium]|nr:hypothetical protein [Sphingobacteriaceae bacterium]
MYRLDNKAFTDKTPSQYFQVVGSNGSYFLNQSPVINFSDQVGFGIATYDQQLAGGNKNGVYSIELFLDCKQIHSSALERFEFEHSRAINSHIDYPALLLYKRTVQKSFVEPGNPLTIYKGLEKNGLISFTDDSVHDMQYLIKDIKGNTSTLNFKIKRNAQSTISVKDEKGVKLFRYTDSTNYTTENIKIAIPRGTLYNDINLQYSISNRPANAYSAIHTIHNRFIPVHKNYHLWIKPDIALPNHLKDKAVIIDSRGIYQGGIFESGYIKAMPKTFGSFHIRVDTIAPIIRPINISDDKSMVGISKIVLKLSDNLSGIRTFRGTIDGHWVLFEYDLKTSTLWHTFEDDLAPGKHNLQFVATDMKMNTRTFNATFYK